MQMKYALSWTAMVDGEVKPWARCDTSGNLLVNIAAGSISAGTEYVEDAAAAANPSGGALILVRRDTLSASEVSADGDNVAAKATAKGEQYVHDTDVLAQLVTLAGYLDGLEGFSDGIEGLITSTNSLLTTQAGYVDGLEALLSTQAGYLDGLETLIGTTNTKLNGGLPAALGSAAAASSLAVTASTEDVARQGAVTETAPVTDTASSGQNGRLQRIAQRLTSLIGLFPTGLGSAAAASSFAVTASTEDVARQGIITETAPATDTASSGQNGRLQRIAQRLTSIIALLPTALAANGGLKVEGVAGGVAQPVTGPQTNTEFLAALRSGTGTRTSVNSGTGSVTILASNASRKGAAITNTDANALYLDMSGGTASSTAYSVKVAADGYFEIPFGYTGLITGIWAADGSGVALVTEFT